MSKQYTRIKLRNVPATMTVERMKNTEIVKKYPLLNINKYGDTVLIDYETEEEASEALTDFGDLIKRRNLEMTVENVAGPKKKVFQPERDYSGKGGE